MDKFFSTLTEEGYSLNIEDRIPLNQLTSTPLQLLCLEPLIDTTCQHEYVYHYYIEGLSFLFFFTKSPLWASAVVTLHALQPAKVGDNQSFG